MSVAEKLNADGIRLRNYEPGNHYTICPKCSDTRKSGNKRKPCLSVAVGPTQIHGGQLEDGRAVWHCFHCGWSGGTGGRVNSFDSRGAGSEAYRPRAGAQAGAARPRWNRWY